MEENEDEPEDVRLATPVEDEIKKGLQEETVEKNLKRTRRTAGVVSGKIKITSDDEDCCAEMNKMRMEMRRESKWRTVHVFGKECKPRKPLCVPRHCLSKKEHLDILATPSRKCPPQCLKKPVIRKLLPVAPRIEELAKPARQRILRTIEDYGDSIAPALLDNLIKLIETKAPLSPEQAAQLFRDRKSRSAKKCKKRRRKMRCSSKEEEEEDKHREKAREKKREHIGYPFFDPEAVCCQYLMAQKFVKSILDWKCPIPKEEFRDIAEVILRRLSFILEYAPTDSGDRKSQQMRFLADVIACWISGVILEVAETHKKELEEECERKRLEEEEETEEEEEDSETEGSTLSRKSDDEDGGDDDEDDDQKPKGKGERRGRDSTSVQENEKDTNDKAPEEDTTQATETEVVEEETEVDKILEREFSKPGSDEKVGVLGIGGGSTKAKIEVGIDEERNDVAGVEEEVKKEFGKDVGRKLEGGVEKKGVEKFGEPIGGVDKKVEIGKQVEEGEVEKGDGKEIYKQVGMQNGSETGLPIEEEVANEVEDLDITLTPFNQRTSIETSLPIEVGSRTGEEVVKLVGKGIEEGAEKQLAEANERKIDQQGDRVIDEEVEKGVEDLNFVLSPDGQASSIKTRPSIRVDDRVGKEADKDADKAVVTGVDKEVDEEIGKQIKKEVVKKADEDIGKQVEKEFGKEFDKEVEKRVDEDIGKQVKKEVDGEVGKEFGKEVKKRADEEIGKQVEEVGKEFDKEVEKRVHEDIVKQVKKEVEEYSEDLDLSFTGIDHSTPLESDVPPKALESDIPFVTFIKISNTIYKMIENEQENSGKDPLTNRLHRAVFEKFRDAVNLENPSSLTDHNQDVIDVISGKIAIWLNRILSESQVSLLKKNPPEVESGEIRDWSKWLEDTAQKMKIWTTWLLASIKESQEIQDYQVNQGQWQEWTRKFDEEGLLWRKYHLDAEHKAHHNTMMMKDRKVVKTGEKKIPEQVIGESTPLDTSAPIKVFQSDLPFINFIKIFNIISNMMGSDQKSIGHDPAINRLHRAVYEKFQKAVELENSAPLTDHDIDVIDVIAGQIAIWLNKVLSESETLLLNKYPVAVESVEIRDWSKSIENDSQMAENWKEWIQGVIEEMRKMQNDEVTRGMFQEWIQNFRIQRLLWRKYYLETVKKVHHKAMMMRDRQVVKTGAKEIPLLEREINAFNFE